MIPSAHVIHIMEGRVRLKVPSRLGDVDYFSKLQEGLADFPAIQDLRVSPVTGSVIIYHEDASIIPLQQFAQEKQLFILKEDQYQSQALLQRAAGGLERLDSGIRNFTRGDLDFRSVLFVLLMVIAIRQLLRGHTVGPASTLLWQALGLVIAASIGKK